MINGIFLTLSFISAGVFGVIFIKQWFDFWIPITAFLGTYLALMLLLALIVFILTRFLSREKEVNVYRKGLHRFFAYLFEYVGDLSGVKLIINGKEKLPKDRRFVLVQNHRSNFDPIVTVYGLKEFPLVFIAKPSLFKMPVIGRFMVGTGFIGINRDSARLAIPAIKRATNNVCSGEFCIAIHPEGTRNLKNNDIQEFHLACLKVATTSKAPVVITTLKNTERVRKWLPFKKTKVILDICEVIESTDYENTATLGAKIRQVMEDNLAKN